MGILGKIIGVEVAGKSSAQSTSGDALDPAKTTMPLDAHQSGLDPTIPKPSAPEAPNSPTIPRPDSTPSSASFLNPTPTGVSETSPATSTSANNVQVVRAVDSSVFSPVSNTEVTNAGGAQGPIDALARPPAQNVASKSEEGRVADAGMASESKVSAAPQIDSSAPVVTEPNVTEVAPASSSFERPPQPEPQIVSSVTTEPMDTNSVLTTATPPNLEERSDITSGKAEEIKGSKKSFLENLLLLHDLKSYINPDGKIKKEELEKDSLSPEVIGKFDKKAANLMRELESRGLSLKDNELLMEGFTEVILQDQKKAA